MLIFQFENLVIVVIEAVVVQYPRLVEENEEMETFLTCWTVFFV